MIELVVFDMAGTTVDDGDAVSSSFQSTLAQVGVKADPALVRSVMGLHKPEAIRILLGAAGRRFSEQDVAAIHENFVRRMLDYYRTDPAVREIPGAAKTFAALRGAGIKVALNTGFNRTIADGLLVRLGWHVPEVIDAVVTSDEVRRGRPHPDMIQSLMARLGVQKAARVAKVGDTRADLEEGVNAGCGLNIGVMSGTFTREELRASPHTHIVGSVREVPAILVPIAG
jgi:phosphonatase-like hydrolase